MSTLDRHQVLIEGTELSKQTAPIVKITVDLSIEKADWFSFTICPADDVTAGTIEVGKPVEIKISDKNNTSTTIFKGFITTVTDEYPEDGDHQLIVEGMDASFKMMKGIKSKVWLDTKHSDVVNSIASQNGVTTGTVDTTTQTYKFLEQSQVSDYQFVAWMAMMNGFEFFINLGKLYFRKPHQSVTVSKTLKWEGEIIHLSRTVDLTDQVGEVKVRGWDLVTKQEVVGTAAAVTSVGGSKTGKQLLNTAFGTKTDEVKGEVYSQAEADLMANSIAYHHGSRLVSGRVKLFGDPTVQAGKYVTIENAGSLNGTYYMVSVVHSLDAIDGFFTEIQLGGTSV